VAVCDECTAVCCIVLQCVSLHYSVSQCVAVCFLVVLFWCFLIITWQDALSFGVIAGITFIQDQNQCVAVRCSALQCVAVRCSALQCVAGCCNVLQCVAMCCSVLQCLATCCSVLQRVNEYLTVTSHLYLTHTY